MELSNPLIILLIPLIFITIPVSSQFHYFNEFCLEDVGNYSANSTYQNNLNLLLSSLKNHASLSLFNNFTVGQGIDKAYGLYMCRGDLDLQECHDCVESASLTITQKCPVEKEAIVWYEECMVRYANRAIFSLEEEGPFSWLKSKNNVTNNVEEFEQVIGNLMDDLITQAAYNTSNRGYAAGEANFTVPFTVYGLVQCTPDILGNPCERCLRVVMRSMAGCCGTTRISMSMYFPSCMIRYDLAPFFNALGTFPPPISPASPDLPLPKSLPSQSSNSLPPPPSTKGGSSATTIRSSVSTFMLLGLMMAVTMSFILNM